MYDLTFAHVTGLSFRLKSIVLINYVLPISLYFTDHHGMSDQYFFPRDKLYQRSPFIPLLDYYPSYFIWMKNYTRLFSIFDSTILQCKQKVDVGIYDPGKYLVHMRVWSFSFMSCSCHLDRVLNVKYLLLLSFSTVAEFYNLGHIQGIIRVN